MSDENTRKPFLDLSLTQLIGGSAAAATAAALGSRLGLVGTIVGAAVVSVISALAGAVYTQSLRRTQEMIRARELIGARELMTRVGQRTSSQPTVRESAVEKDGEPEETDTSEVTAAPSIWQHVTWKTVAITAAVVFAIAGLAITGTELLTGRSLDGSKGTTVSNVVHGGGSSSRDTPTPTPDTTSTPSVSASPVPTGVPSAVGSATPTDTATPTPTPTPTPTTSDLPTGTVSPSASSSGAADPESSTSATP